MDAEIIAANVPAMIWFGWEIASPPLWLWLGLLLLISWQIYLVLKVLKRKVRLRTSQENIAPLVVVRIGLKQPTADSLPPIAAIKSPAFFQSASLQDKAPHGSTPSLPLASSAQVLPVTAPIADPVARLLQHPLDILASPIQLDPVMLGKLPDHLLQNNPQIAQQNTIGTISEPAFSKPAAQNIHSSSAPSVENPPPVLNEDLDNGLVHNTQNKVLSINGNEASIDSQSAMPESIQPAIQTSSQISPQPSIQPNQPAVPEPIVSEQPAVELAEKSVEMKAPPVDISPLGASFPAMESSKQQEVLSEQPPYNHAELTPPDSTVSLNDEDLHTHLKTPPLVENIQQISASQQIIATDPVMDDALFIEDPAPLKSDCSAETLLNPSNNKVSAQQPQIITESQLLLLQAAWQAWEEQNWEQSRQLLVDYQQACGMDDDNQPLEAQTTDWRVHSLYALLLAEKGEIEQVESLMVNVLLQADFPFSMHVVPLLGALSDSFSAASDTTAAIDGPRILIRLLRQAISQTQQMQADDSHASPSQAAPANINILTHDLQDELLDELYSLHQHSLELAGDIPAAITALEIQLALRQQREDVAGQLDVIDKLGKHCFAIHRKQDAKRYYQQGLDLREQLQPEPDTASNS